MDKPKSHLSNYTPLFVFILISFLLEIMHISRITGVAASLLVSWMMYMMETRIVIKEHKPVKILRRQIHNRIGLLSIISTATLLLLLGGLFQWLAGWMLFGPVLVMLLFYFIVLFNAIHLNIQAKEKEKKK